MPFNSWSLEIDLYDVWKSEDIPVPEQIRIVYERLVGSEWMDITNAPFTLGLLLQDFNDLISQFDEEELDEFELVDNFDDLWDAFYDLADSDRVWINTQFPPRD